MRILFVGDVVGRAGRTAIAEYLPGMVRDWALDLVVVNGENSAGGFGITEAIYQEFLDAGADAVTLGNHSWDQREALVFIERAPKLIRPANFPKGAPGRGAALVDTKNGKRALVINAIGRVFMTPFDDPFATLNRELEACPLREAADAIVVDFHGEATSEKQGIGYGAGHYDFTLAHLRKVKAITAVGAAFSLQEIKAVPALPHDVALDYVLTEKKVFDFRS